MGAKSLGFKNVFDFSETLYMNISYKAEGAVRLLLAPAQMLCGSQAAAKLIPQLILLGLTEVKWDSDRLQCDLQHRSRLCGTSSLVHLFDHQHCG